MHSPRELERRMVPMAALRVARRESDPRPMLSGRAIVFDALSEDLGGFRERIRPEAIDRTLRDALDVRALVDHNTEKILGRLSAKTLRLSVSRAGLDVEIDLPKTSYADDVLESIGRGDMDGMSFAFRTIDDAWHLEDGAPVRELLDMEVHEVSVVTFPAYVMTSVDVAHRSLARARDAGRCPDVVVRTIAGAQTLAMLRNRQRHAGAW